MKSVYDNSILNNVRGDSWTFKVKLLLEGFFTFLPSFLVSNNVLQMLFTKNGLRQCHKHIICKPEINLWIRVLLIHYISFYNKTWKHSQVIFATEELAVICIGFLQRLH